MAVQNGSTTERGEDSTSVGSERTAWVKENTLARTGKTATGVDGRPEGPIPAKGGAILMDSGSADGVTWLWQSQQPCDDDLQVSSWVHKELERLMMTTKREDGANARRTGSSARQKERPPKLGKQPAPMGSSNPPPLRSWVQSPIRTPPLMEAPPVKPFKPPKPKAKDSIKGTRSTVVLETTFVKGRRLWHPNGLGQIWQLAQVIEDCNNLVKLTGLDQLMVTTQLLDDKNMPIKSLKDPNGLRNTKPMLFSIDKAQEGEKGLLHRGNLVQTTGDQFERWNHLVRKEKSVYHTLNMRSLEVTKKCLVAEGWSPTFLTKQIQDALERAGHDSSQVGAIFQVLHTRESPPTYFRTNKFITAFQEIFYVYGVAKYQEANPG